MLTSGCVLRCVCAGMRGRTERCELREQLCLLHSPGGHFTQSKWISRTVDPITSAVTRHWANQLVHRTMASFGPPTKLECVQVSAHGPFLAPKYIYPNTRGETWARKAYLKLKIILHCVPSSFYQAYSCLLAIMTKCVQTNTHMHWRELSYSTVLADMRHDLW